MTLLLLRTYLDRAKVELPRDVDRERRDHCPDAGVVQECNFGGGLQQMITREGSQ